MRLIDADALYIDYLYPTTTTSTTCYRYVSMQQINNAPTIEAVQERKKGRWVRKKDEQFNVWWWECSECGGSPLKSVFNRQDVLSEYCPHCGANMEGAEDDA